MPRTPFSTITPHAGALVLALLTSTPALAAELAEPSVRSYQGQQLSADIELVSLGADEADGVQVRLAQPNVYQGANVAMHPALRGVHLSVARRDGRQFLHMTTLQPVDADHLIVFFEMGPAGRQEVRSATLWLQPDPHPAPPPAPAAVASEAAAPSPVADAALVAARARAARTVAPAPRPRPSPSPEAPAVAPSSAAKGAAQAASPTAPQAAASDEHAAAASPVAKRVTPRNLAAAISGKQKASDVPASAAAAASSAAASAAEAAPLPAESKSGHAPLKAASAPAAACPSRPVNMSSSECAVLDARNVVLVTKLGLLEAKVHKLQQEIEPAGSAEGGEGKGAAKAAPGASSVSAAASISASAEAAASASAAEASASASMHTPQKNGRVLPKLKYKKDKEKPPETGTSMTLLAAGGVAAAAVLALLGWLFWKRRKAGKSNAPLKIWQGWRKKKAEPAQEHEPAQPLEEVMPESLLEPE